MILLFTASSKTLPKGAYHAPLGKQGTPFKIARLSLAKQPGIFEYAKKFTLILFAGTMRNCHELLYGPS